MNLARRLRLLIALAGLGAACAACGPTTEDATPTEAAVLPPNTSAMKTAVWRYYLGYTSTPEPSMTMFAADHGCSPLPLDGGYVAYRFGRFFGACNPDNGHQYSTSPYSFYATYEEWTDRYPVPGGVMPWYATTAVNFMCIAAYRRMGFTDAQLAPRCSGDPSSTVPAVRRYIHDTYYAGTPFWQ